MNELKGDFSFITRHDIIEYLLRASGQIKQNSVNPSEIIKLLKIDYVRLNFSKEFGQETFPKSMTPRALLSFPNNVIATDEGLSPAREKFSIFHEVGHYVLPSHRDSMYICDPSESDIPEKHTKLEAQASEFAAELLFIGDRFIGEANSFALSAKTVKELGNKYEASYEATARRLIDKRIKPGMLIVFKNVSSTLEPHWVVSYWVGNSSFKNKYFESLEGEPPKDIIAKITASGRDIADSVIQEISISIPTGQSYRFVSEYFYNQYNIFCFLSEPK